MLKAVILPENCSHHQLTDSFSYLLLLPLTSFVPVWIHSDSTFWVSSSELISDLKPTTAQVSAEGGIIETNKINYSFELRKTRISSCGFMPPLTCEVTVYMLLFSVSLSYSNKLSESEQVLMSDVTQVMVMTKMSLTIDHNLISSFLALSDTLCQIWISLLNTLTLDEGEVTMTLTFCHQASWSGFLLFYVLFAVFFNIPLKIPLSSFCIDHIKPKKLPLLKWHSSLLWIHL